MLTGLWKRCLGNVITICLLCALLRHRCRYWALTSDTEQKGCQLFKTKASEDWEATQRPEVRTPSFHPEGSSAASVLPGNGGERCCHEFWLEMGSGFRPNEFPDHSTLSSAPSLRHLCFLATLSRESQGGFGNLLRSGIHSITEAISSHYLPIVDVLWRDLWHLLYVVPYWSPALQVDSLSAETQGKPFWLQGTHENWEMNSVQTIYPLFLSGSRTLASLTINGCARKPRRAGEDGGSKQSELRDSVGAGITHSILSDRQRANVLLPS